MKAHHFRAWHDAETQNQRKADNKRTLEQQYTRRPLLAPLRPVDTIVINNLPMEAARAELERLGLK
jgi:hypothetical protein